MSLKKVVECVRKYNNFLISTHTSPEGDALGSELAFYQLIKKLGKSATIINDDNTPCCYNFLPGKENIKKFKRSARGIKFDCFVVLDCSDSTRTGQVYRLNLKPHKPVLNIDHHISNQMFGDVNWVEQDSSCCSEMIFKLYKELRQSLDNDAALSLYVGIFTDTGSFRYANTTAFTHKVVSELLKYNIDIRGIYKNIYEDIPFQDIKLLVKILPAVKRKAKGKIVWFQIERNVLRKKKIFLDLTDSLLSFARSIKDTEVAVLFKENFGAKNEVSVNLRSQGKVDVNKIALFFGGGGHKTASGCTIKGDINSVRRMVLDKIGESLE